MEVRVHDPAAIQRLLALLDDAIVSGLADQPTGMRLKRAVSAGMLSSRDIAEYTMSLLLGESDQVDVYASLSPVAMRLDVPTRNGAAELQGNLQPTAGQLQPQATELERVSHAGELATAWSTFASLARGLTSRPWAEVERAFINADSREAAETREVAAAQMGVEGNPGDWLLDIDQNALARQPDPTATYAAIVSAWQQWCMCTKRVGGLGAAQKLLTDMAIQQHHEESDYSLTSRCNSLGDVPAQYPKHTGNPQLDRTRGVDDNDGRDPSRVQLSGVASPRSCVDLQLATPGTSRGLATIHKMAIRPRPRQPTKTRVASKANTDTSLTSTFAVRTPRQPRSLTCRDSRSPAARSQSTSVHRDGNLAASREANRIYRVENLRDGSQRDDASHDSPFVEGEPLPVDDENSSAYTEPSDSHTGGIQEAKQDHVDERGRMHVSVAIETEALKRPRQGRSSASGTSHQHVFNSEDDDDDDDDGDDDDQSNIGSEEENPDTEESEAVSQTESDISPEDEDADTEESEAESENEPDIGSEDEDVDTEKSEAESENENSTAMREILHIAQVNVIDGTIISTNLDENCAEGKDTADDSEDKESNDHEVDTQDDDNDGDDDDDAKERTHASTVSGIPIVQQPIALERQAAAASPVTATFKLQQGPTQPSLIDTACTVDTEKYEHENAAKEQTLIHATTTWSAPADDAAIRSRLIHSAQNTLGDSEQKLDGAPVPQSPRASAVRLRLEQKARCLDATSAATTPANGERTSGAASCDPVPLSPRASAVRLRLEQKARGLNATSAATTPANAERTSGSTNLADTVQSRATIRTRLLLAASHKNTP